MKSVIITIGDEILYGDTVDTNAAWIGKELTSIGVEIVGRITTGDTPSEMLKAYTRAEEDADLIIITGGLGPTNDDKTKDCLCAFFDTKLVEHVEQRQKVIHYYTSRGRSASEVTDKMVLQPQIAEVILNNFGVAPALWINKGKKHFIALPGVPIEMKGLMSEEILPRIVERINLNSVQHRYFITAGRGETTLATRLVNIEADLPQHISLAYLPNFNRVIVRITGKSSNAEQLSTELDDIASQMRPLLNDVTFSETIGDTLVHAIAKLSKQKQFTIGCAESCTGGNVMHHITQLEGASSFFEGGFVTYSNQMKQEQLRVNPQTLADYGAVSEQTVAEMVQGTLSRLHCDYAVATSGIAGPTGGTETKPVGTVCIAVGNSTQIITKTFTFAKNREKNIQLATTTALNMLYRLIKDTI